MFTEGESSFSERERGGVGPGQRGPCGEGVGEYETLSGQDEEEPVCDEVRRCCSRCSTTYYFSLMRMSSVPKLPS